MPSRARSRVLSLLAFGGIVAGSSGSAAQAQSPPSPPSSAVDSQAQAALSRVVASALSDSSPHMRMAPTRTATASDSARAAGVVITTRAALHQYVDVKVAERDGYYRNMSMLEDQPIYHYNSVRNFGAAERGEFDLAKPVSLLYKKDNRGALRLIGAMYAAGGSAAPEALDALLPISMAHWHEHVNFCYPGPGVHLPSRKIDAGTAFLVKLFFSITSAKECEADGGRFLPVEGGWMTHVYMFAGSDDPKAIWDADELGNVETHMGHPPTNRL